VKLNWVETLLMNNPARASVQRWQEAPGLIELADKPFKDAETLVIGCGRGVDIEVAFEQFQAARVTAIDLDEKQVARADARLGGRYGKKLDLRVGDSARMPFDAAAFDLVLDFGIIHHVPEWRAAVSEVSRVLKTGGQFLFEEIPKSELETLLYRLFTDHPRADRFNAPDFQSACENAGLKIARGTEAFRILIFKAFRGAAVKS
jgi:ubiquinone/menaquinone biosynthesis C-methylase UbiE